MSFRVATMNWNNRTIGYSNSTRNSAQMYFIGEMNRKEQ